MKKLAKVIAILVLVSMVGTLFVGCAEDSRTRVKAKVINVLEDEKYVIESENGERFTILLFYGDPLLTEGDVVWAISKDLRGKFLRW